MPKISGKVIKSGHDKDGNLLCLIQMNGKKPDKGTPVSVKWGSVRSLQSNSFYWVFLNWLIEEGGLKDQGHFFAEELHGNLKKHLLGKGVKAEDEVTTTDLTKMEFSEYFETVDRFVQEFFEIDTAPFFEKYKQEYGDGR